MVIKLEELRERLGTSIFTHLEHPPLDLGCPGRRAPTTCNMLHHLRPNAEGPGRFGGHREF